MIVSSVSSRMLSVPSLQRKLLNLQNIRASDMRYDIEVNSAFRAAAPGCSSTAACGQAL